MWMPACLVYALVAIALLLGYLAAMTAGAAVALIFAVLVLMRCHRILTAELPRWGQTSALYGIGAIASYWFIARVAMFFSVSAGY